MQKQVEDNEEKRKISLNVNSETYAKFQAITKKYGTNASAKINELIYEYVEIHKDSL